MSHYILIHTCPNGDTAYADFKEFQQKREFPNFPQFPSTEVTGIKKWQWFPAGMPSMERNPNGMQDYTAYPMANCSFGVHDNCVGVNKRVYF